MSHFLECSKLPYLNETRSGVKMIWNAWYFFLSIVSFVTHVILISSIFMHEMDTLFLTVVIHFSRNVVMSFQLLI